MASVETQRITLAVQVHTVALTEEFLMQLRRMRLYHWKAVLQIREGMQRTKSNSGALAMLKTAHREHLGYVQALNDFFPVGETAERDAVSGVCDDE